MEEYRLCWEAVLRALAMALWSSTAHCWLPEVTQATSCPAAAAPTAAQVKRSNWSPPVDTGLWALADRLRAKVNGRAATACIVMAHLLAPAWCMNDSTFPMCCLATLSSALLLPGAARAARPGAGAPGRRAAVLRHRHRGVRQAVPRAQGGRQEGSGVSASTVCLHWMSL